MKPQIIYLNNEFAEYANAKIHFEDRGYNFADGVYEVALIKNGVFIDWEEHCTRLQNSLNGLRINYKVSPDNLKTIVNELLAKNGLQCSIDTVMYLQITRGVAKRDHPFPDPAVEPSIIIKVSPAKYLSQENYANGVSAITTPDTRGTLCNYKTIALLPNVLAKQEAVEKKVTEAIFVQSSGIVTEGSATNIFIVINGKLLTHPLSNKILGGITRLGVLIVAREQDIQNSHGKKIEVLEQEFTKSDLLKANEVFITSTTKGVLPVTKIDNQKIGDGKQGWVTKELMRRYQAYIDRQANNPHNYNQKAKL
jgi:D-alanine transaminase